MKRWVRSLCRFTMNRKVPSTQIQKGRRRAKEVNMSRILFGCQTGKRNDYDIFTAKIGIFFAFVIKESKKTIIFAKTYRKWTSKVQNS